MSNKNRLALLDVSYAHNYSQKNAHKMLTKLNTTKEPHSACAPPSSCECTDSRKIRRSLAMPGFGWQAARYDMLFFISKLKNLVSPRGLIRGFAYI